MATWVCGFDESSDQNPTKHFFFVGVSAPEGDWQSFFEPAWKERVLNGLPAIDYLHMVDILSGRWQQEHGLTRSDSRRRVDEAANVIRSMGSLFPVCVWVNTADYNAILRQPYQPQPGQTKDLDADYMCFFHVSVVQLTLVHENPGSDLTRMDFWVEKNGKVTHHVETFHAAIAKGLPGGDNVTPLVGLFKPVDKTAIPAQVADVIAWHALKFENGTLDLDGQKRYWKMRTDGVGGSRGHWNQMSTDLLRRLAAAFTEAEARGPIAGP